MSKTPAIPGSVLRAGTAKEGMSAKDQKTYCSGVGKLLFLMKWSWPDVLNSQGLKPIHELGMTLTFNGHGTCHAILVEFLGLTTFNSLLQYVNWLVWEVCSVNNCQSEQGSLVTGIETGQDALHGSQRVWH